MRLSVYREAVLRHGGLYCCLLHSRVPALSTDALPSPCKGGQPKSLGPCYPPGGLSWSPGLLLQLDLALALVAIWGVKRDRRSVALLVESKSHSNIK